VAVAPVPGTPFGVALVEVTPTSSGPATASLVTGIASILVASITGCFAAVGANPGWGAAVAGAFAVLAGLAGAAAIWLASVGLRRTRPVPGGLGWGAIKGRRMAVAGLVCGLVGIVVTVLIMVAAVSG